jgi:NitT/TauT family transport system substrate-binding protein
MSTKSSIHRVCLFLSAVFAGLSPLSADTPSVVEVSDLGAVSDAPFYIGIERGYFAAEGINVKLTKFASAAQVIVPLATNRLQVAGGGASVGFFNAIASDWPIRLAMARTRDVEGYSTDTVLVRTDLKDQIKSIKDLRGRKIASTAAGSIFDFMLGKMLATEGMTVDDLNVVYMSFPDMAVALQTKAIDIALVTEPFAARYTGLNLATHFLRAADIIKEPPMEVGFILYSKDWMDQNADTAKRFTVAYLKGLRDYYDAMRGGPKRAEVVDILIKYTALKDKSVYDSMAWSYMDPNGTISITGLKEQQTWYLERGLLKKASPIESVIDTRPLDFALEKLGRVSTN